jgi:DNA topoisomerase-1
MCCGQVFRTYNASITLDRLLSEMEEAEDAYVDKTVDAKKADYDRANKEVRPVAAFVYVGCCMVF